LPISSRGGPMSGPVFDDPRRVRQPRPSSDNTGGRSKRSTGTFRHNAGTFAVILE
jgi:hypothetical protein